MPMLSIGFIVSSLISGELSSVMRNDQSSAAVVASYDIIHL